MTRSSLARSCAVAILALTIAGPAMAQENIRGDTTGPTTAPGYSHPEQYMHVTPVAPADNMYPVVQHPEQDTAVAAKLAALEPARSRISSSS
jgi:hypothetical protein